MAEGIQYIDSSQKEMRERLDEDVSLSDGMPERSAHPTEVGKRKGRLNRTLKQVLDEALGA